ncbi:hypothetical protein OAO01_05335 [Oligoflexia bacterium]|nr:hypothetical protein [Oligoflexia bacterium]
MAKETEGNTAQNATGNTTIALVEGNPVGELEEYDKTIVASLKAIRAFQQNLAERLEVLEERLGLHASEQPSFTPRREPPTVSTHPFPHELYKMQGVLYQTTICTVKLFGNQGSNKGFLINSFEEGWVRREVSLIEELIMVELISEREHQQAGWLSTEQLTQRIQSRTQALAVPHKLALGTIRSAITRIRGKIDSLMGLSTTVIEASRIGYRLVPGDYVIT